MRLLHRFIFFTVLVTAGCRNLGSGGGASAGQPPAAAAAQGSGVQARLPEAVAAAFGRGHPGANASFIHVRLFPDGTTHYQIIYLDANGQSHQAEYFASGQPVPTAQ